MVSNSSSSYPWWAKERRSVYTHCGLSSSQGWRREQKMGGWVVVFFFSQVNLGLSARILFVQDMSEL